MMSLTREALKRLHYPVDIIAQCVCWYLAYALSLRNLEEILAERGIAVDHSTLSCWSCIQYVYYKFYCVEPIAAYNTKITL